MSIYDIIKEYYSNIEYTTITKEEIDKKIDNKGGQDNGKIHIIFGAER